MALEQTEAATIREHILAGARDAVLRDRNKSYGGPEDSFARIAAFWSTFLGYEVKPTDVAPMLALLKIARLAYNPSHMDSFVDLAGYAACGAEVAASAKAKEAYEVVEK